MSSNPTSGFGSETVVENLDAFSIADVLANLPSNHHVISPLLFFQKHNTNGTRSSNNSTNVLLILNQQINVPPKLFANIWNSTSVKVCADGGLNRLRDYDESYTPHYVVGDLDSATNENTNFYASRGTKVILQSSQYYTDFTKSIAVIKTHLGNKSFLSDLPDTLDSVEKYAESSEFPLYDGQINVLLLGGVGGRFDQSMQIISQLYHHSVENRNIEFTLLNSEHSELIFLLKKGVNFINYPKLTPDMETEIFGQIQEKSRPNMRNVGILPILNPAIINTSGLKWDVTNWSSSIVTKMSSSNLQAANEGFVITTNEPLILNFEL